MKQDRMKTAHWTQSTHLFRDDEYICSSCGAAMKKTKYDPSRVDEAEGMSALFDDDW